MSQFATTDTGELAAANQRNLRRLILSVQASLHKLNLLIAICDNPLFRDELVRTYEAELNTKGITCYQVQLDRQQPSLKQSLLNWQSHTSNWQSETPTVVTIRGGDELLGIRLEQAQSAQEKFFFSLQWTREGLREFQLPIVLWVTEAVARGLAQQAPDFWSWRGGVFEFFQPMVWQLPDSWQPIERQLESGDEPLADPAELEQLIAVLEAEDPDSPLLESLYQILGETYYKRLKRGIASDRSQEEAKAIAAFREAISRRENFPDPTPLAISLNDLAVLYEAQGRYGEAEPLLLRSLQIQEQQLGKNHPDTALALNNLAHLYHRQGRYGEAELLLLRSLQVRDQQLGADHPDTALALNNLAGLYCSQGRYGEAEPLLLRSLQVREQQLGADHPDTALVLNNLAELYCSQGRYREAEPLYLRALQIDQQIYGENHPEVATDLNNLALWYKSQGRYQEAEPLYLRSLEIREQHLGVDHPDTAATLNNLALLYDSQGRYQEAEPLLLQSLETAQKRLPEDHPSTNCVLDNFRCVVQRAVAAGRAGELSDHPITQAVLQKVIGKKDE